MLAPKVPLRLIASYDCPRFSENSASMETRKKSVEIALKNCYITRDICSEQMREVKDKAALEDICQMRREALVAIPLGESVSKATSLDDFNRLEKEFRKQYDNLISAVKSFLWDAGPLIRQSLWLLVEDIM
jgi:hypothetical protein